MPSIPQFRRLVLGRPFWRSRGWELVPLQLWSYPYAISHDGSHWRYGRGIAAQQLPMPFWWFYSSSGCLSPATPGACQSLFHICSGEGRWLLNPHHRLGWEAAAAPMTVAVLILDPRVCSGSVISLRSSAELSEACYSFGSPMENSGKPRTLETLLPEAAFESIEMERLAAEEVLRNALQSYWQSLYFPVDGHQDIFNE